jgi:hypothetical protein
VPIQEAALASPTLARLAELAQDSGNRLKAVQPLIPDALRSCVRAGPIDGPTWCLLVDNNAVAAKLRQLLPAFQSCLQSRGWQVNAIRLKVQINAQR